MAQFKVERLPQNTIKIIITLSWEDISKSREKVIDKTVETAELKGFRKGKAPRNIVEQSISPDKILNQAIQELVPELYSQAIKDLELKPILLPDIHIESGEVGKNWILHALTCEAPTVKLDGFKDKLKGDLSAANIWTPGKDKEDTKKPDEKREEKLSKIIEWLLKNVEVEIPDLLVTSETNHMLSRLFDQLQKLGLTVDQYLASKGKTAEDMRAEFANSARDNLKLEFVLDAISREENTRPSNEEVEKWVKDANPQTKEILSDPAQKSSLTSVLARQKTLDFLLGLA
jgi:FKBP-type peptidyl-prolyl cis-trans isomerase (trigger factor)